MIVAVLAGALGFVWGIACGVLAEAAWQNRHGGHTEVVPSFTAALRGASIRAIAGAAVALAIVANAAVGFLQIQNGRDDARRDECVQRDRLDELAFYRTLRRSTRANTLTGDKFDAALTGRIESIEAVIALNSDEAKRCEVEP